MRNSPVVCVDPAEFAPADRSRIAAVVEDAERTGTLDLGSLPLEVRDQLLFAVAAIARGETVLAVANGKPLTSTEAATALGMSRSLLTRLCEEGRIESFSNGNALRIPATEVMRILNERANAKADARVAATTADQRRRARAAQLAG